MTTALILAGGLGSRLHSVLDGRPKALAPVLGKPFIGYQLEFLASHGIRDVVLCLGYQAAQIQAAIRDGSAWGLAVYYSVEPRPLGTGGALRLAQPWVGTDTFLVLNGDTYHQFNPPAFLASQKGRAGQGCVVTLLSCRVGDASERGVLSLADGWQVKGFVEKQATGPGWVNAGAYAVQPELLEAIPAGEFVSLERDVLPALAREGRLYAHPASGRFIDIGTPAGLGDFAAAMEAVSP